MEFRWNEWNVEHIAIHGVEPEEAEWVVRGRGSLSQFGMSKKNTWFGVVEEEGDFCRWYIWLTRMEPFSSFIPVP